MKDLVGGFAYGVIMTLITLVQAWAFMLLVGAVHSEAAQVPAISFNASVWLVLAGHVLITPATSVGRQAV